MKHRLKFLKMFRQRKGGVIFCETVTDKDVINMTLFIA